MIKGIDHVAIAVDNLDETLEKFELLFGVKADHREVIESYHVEVATVNLGNTCIEFVEGKTPDSPTRKYIEKKGPGIHHVALEVDDIAAAISALTAAGARMIDQTPRPGKDGSLVAFVHPSSTGKTLYELVQVRKPPEDDR
ncbi:MAG: methylmalonyl-CoA epimerase [Candidatus Krumholzibacteria bacterium]|nr:methylmalonyl-CoA epimerase [Candidatus Krumholzibacteria bacterium]